MITIKEIIFGNNQNMKNLSCVNIDCHTIAMVDKLEPTKTTLMFKHAVNGCEGITAQQLDKSGDIKYSQNSHLSKWLNDKSTVQISINGNVIDCKLHSYTTFSIFLSEDRYINKSRIEYIKGPTI